MSVIMAAPVWQTVLNTQNHLKQCMTNNSKEESINMFRIMHSASWSILFHVSDPHFETKTQQVRA